jgi:putative transposase
VAAFFLLARAGMNISGSGRPPAFSRFGPHRYSLTFFAFNRQPLFVSETLVTTLRSQIVRAGEVCRFNLLAYCFMPDHLHLLAGGLMPPVHLPTFARRARQLSDFYGRRHTRGPIWQSGYFEHVLRPEEDTRTAVLRILDNPVRAGLVVDAASYRFSGSAICSLAELVAFVNDCG